MKKVVNDLNSALALVRSAMTHLADYENKNTDNENIDEQGLEDIEDYILSAESSIEDALREIPYTVGEK